MSRRFALASSPARIALIAVFATALLVRVDGLGSPPLGFSSATIVRQYHSALLARSYYVDGLESAPAWEKRVARANRDLDAPIEPPLLEFAAATAYAMVGGERLWIPRLFSSLGWLLGGVFVYLIARRITTAPGAAVSLAFYLFLPASVYLSRAFQPDPLMVTLLLGGVYALLRYDESPSPRRLFTAAAIAAAASAIKPGIALLFLVPLLAFLAVSRNGLRALVSSRALPSYVTLAVLPTAAYYLYATRATDYLSGHVEDKVRPELLTTLPFWHDWLSLAAGVVELLPTPRHIAGLGLLCAALAGILLARAGRPRALLLGLFTGYAIYGVVFTQHIRSHDYYSLPLIPLVALALGPAAARLAGGVPRLARPVLLAGVCSLALVGLWRQHLEATDGAYGDEVALYERIGELVDHPASSLILAEKYGNPLRYHARLAGNYWPSGSNLEAEREAGLRSIGPAERFRTRNPAYYPAVATLRPPPEYFIVTRLEELDRQAELERFLRSSFPGAIRDPEYVIFGLRR